MLRGCALVLALVLSPGLPRAAETLVPARMLSTADPRLEVTLWAASPLLRNPPNIDADKDGRIWVAEGVNYRRHYDRQPAGDRIVVLEDTNRDGKADRSSTFVQEPFLRAPLGRNKEGKYAGSDYKGGDRSVSAELKTYFRPSSVTVGPTAPSTSRTSSIRRTLRGP